MSKHVSFWLGVFSAGLVIMPVALGIWALAQGLVEDIAAALFIAISILVFVLVIVLFFRGPILRRLVGRGEASIEDISTSLVASVSAAASGDRMRVETEAEALVRMTMGWYAWSNFYRWVIGTALALLLAFASFTGTVLLFEQLEKLEQQTSVMDKQRELMEAQTKFMESQTERLEEQTQQAEMQNEIMTLSLVSELRGQLLATIEEVNVFDFMGKLLADGAFFISLPNPTNIELVNGDECSLKANKEMTLLQPPSSPTLLSIFELANDGTLSSRVVSALEFLQEDRNQAVAFGAANVLAMLGKYEHILGRQFDGLLLSGYDIKISGQLNLSRSAVIFAECEDCWVVSTDSIFVASKLDMSSSSNSFIYGIEARISDILDSIVLLPEEQDSSSFVIKVDGEEFSELSFGGRGGSFLTINDEPPDKEIMESAEFRQPTCSDLENFSQLNPFWNY